MEVTFTDDDLDRLDADPTGRTKFDQRIVRAFGRAIQLFRDATDERDIWGVVGSKNFKKLKGDRSHQYSLRLNDQWRLIVEIEKGNTSNRIRVISIEDYH